MKTLDRCKTCNNFVFYQFLTRLWCHTKNGSVFCNIDDTENSTWAIPMSTDDSKP